MNKETIKSIIALKQSEIPFNVISRDLRLPIDSRQIITTPGIRRCGKSTLMMLAINELVANGVDKSRILWMGFDDERLIGMRPEDLNTVIDAYMEMFPDIRMADVYMFFDEIQLVEGWEYFVLRVYKSYCKNVFVSGSNAQMLSGELSSALRGWPLEYEAYPLSFREFCLFKGIDTESHLESDLAKVRNAFTEYNIFGGFPEVTLIQEVSIKIKKLQGYFNTMLFRDMMEHYKLGSSEVVRYFLKRLMLSVSKPVSIHSIYNDLKSQGLKIGKDSLYLWVDYACNTFMFYKVPKFSPSEAAEQRALYKYYCADNGLRNAVLLPQSEDRGILLENTIFLHLKKTCGPADKISYFSDKQECDFVVRRGTKTDRLIQVTWEMESEKTRTREINGLIAASNRTNCDHLTIVTYDSEETIEQDGKRIQVMPAWRFVLNEPKG